jgi:predicted secreted protein
MHPLHRPVVLIIWLCAVIIGLNVLVLFWLQTGIPSTHVASSQADRTSIRLVEPPAETAPCQPTVVENETPLAERDAAIAQLQGEIHRLKSTKGDDGAAWRTKAEQVEKNAAERVAERDAAIAQLQGEIHRLKSTKGDDGAAWRTKAEQVEKDLMVLQKAAERVLEMDARNWQEGKLMLAHALVKEKI